VPTVLPGKPEVHTVEKVEELSAQLQPFAQLDVFENREVRRPPASAVQNVPAAGSERATNRLGNAAVLSHCSRLSWKPLCGAPTCWANWPEAAQLQIFPLTPTENGNPLRMTC
jgi:hypothetical protein